jgi:peroxiredoxin
MKMKWMLAGIVTAVYGCLMVGCSSRPANSYILTGELEGLADGTRVQLYPVSHDNEQPLADTVVMNGKFVFTGSMDEPRAVRLVADGYGSTSLILENEDIRLQGKVSVSSVGQTQSYDFSQVTVKGSPLSDKYRQLLSARDTLDVIYQQNNERFAAIRDLYGKARLTKDQILMDSVLATSAFRESAMADSLFFATVEQTYYRTVMQEKNNFFGPLMMISFFSYLDEDQASWFDEFPQEVKESYYGRMVQSEVKPQTAVGKKVPDFTVKDEAGKEYSLEALCENKSYVLIDFWASWCNPCRKEIPNLKNLYTQYADRGFQIISLSIDQKKEEWQKALAEEKLAWPNFLDTEGVSALYKVKFVPTMYLIDAQGKVVAENLRGDELAKKLSELFQ